jgi:hypothetical protein
MEVSAMNKVLFAAAFAAATVIGLPVLAQDRQVKAAPVDFRACTFREGKGMKDLDKVAEKFRAYANKNDFSYAAWALIPEFANAVPYDFGWLGAWPSSEAFGVSMEKWKTTGRDLAAEFAEVMDCGDRHELAMWVPITAPESSPEEGVLMIARCTLKEGKSDQDAYRAHLAFGKHMRGLGSLASSWLFYPTMGTGDIDYDYYHAAAFYRYSDLGAAMELYANAGGHEAARKLLDPVSECRAPIVFDAISLRAFDER